MWRHIKVRKEKISQLKGKSRLSTGSQLLAYLKKTRPALAFVKVRAIRLHHIAVQVCHFIEPVISYHLETLKQHEEETP
jgi:hypothetical protein